MLEKIKWYLQDKRHEVIVFGIMFAMSFAIAFAMTGDPGQALAHRHRR